MSSPDSFPLWKTILEIAETIELTNRKNGTKKDLIQILDSFEMALKGRSDPLIEFEAFVIRRFCRAIRESLEKI
jgi:hypothetical protein